MMTSKKRMHIGEASDQKANVVKAQDLPGCRRHPPSGWTGPQGLDERGPEQSEAAFDFLEGCLCLRGPVEQNGGGGEGG